MSKAWFGVRAGADIKVHPITDDATVDTKAAGGYATSHGSFTWVVQDYCPDTHITGCCFAPNGASFVAYGSGGLLTAFDVSNGAELWSSNATTAGVASVTFSQDGKLLAAAGNEEDVYVYDATNGQQLCTVSTGGRAVVDCSFAAASQQLLTLAGEGRLAIWSVPGGAKLAELSGVQSTAAAALADDAAVVVACARDDDIISIYTVADGTPTEVGFDSICENSMLLQCAVAPGGNALLYSTDTSAGDGSGGANLVLYCRATNEVNTVEAHGGSVSHASLSADGSVVVSCCADGGVSLWDVKTGRTLMAVAPPAAAAASSSSRAASTVCYISNDKQHIVVADNQGSVRCRRAADGGTVCQLAMGIDFAISDCRVSSDGQSVVMWDLHGRCVVWRMAVTGLFQVLKAAGEHACCCCLTTCDEQLLMGSRSGVLALWDVRRASPLWQQHLDTAPVESVAVTHDGSMLAAGCFDGSVTMADLSSGEVLAKLSGEHLEAVGHCSFSGDGSMLLSASRDGGPAVLWDVDPASKGRYSLLRRLQSGLGRCIKCCCWSADGSLVGAGTYEGAALVWTAHDGHLQTLACNLPASATSCSFSPDGLQLAVAGEDGTTCVLDARSGAMLIQLSSNASSVVDCFWSSKEVGCSLGGNSGGAHAERLVTVCSRQAITWDTGNRPDPLLHRAEFLCDGDGTFRDLTVPDRTYAAHDRMCCYDPATAALMYDMQGFDGDALACSSSYLLRLGCVGLTSHATGQRLLLHSPSVGPTVSILSAKPGSAMCIDFSSDGRLLATGSAKGHLAIWDVWQGRRMYAWRGMLKAACTAVKFTDDGELLLSGGEDRKVMLWDWRKQTAVATLTGHVAAVSGCDISLDGCYIVSGDRHGVVMLWDARQHVQLRRMEMHSGAVLSVTIAPDGSSIVSAGEDGRILVTDAHTGAVTASLAEALDGSCSAVKFSFDGTRVMVCSKNGRIMVWDVKRSCQLYDLEAHAGGQVSDCSWSGDSRLLLSVGTDGRAVLWDSASGSMQCEISIKNTPGLTEHAGLIRGDLSRDGACMAGCTAKGTLVRWDVAAAMRKAPHGSAVYGMLAGVPLTRAKSRWQHLSSRYPCLLNQQDAQGWSLLMHAVHNSNAEITKLLVGLVPPGSGRISLSYAGPCSLNATAGSRPPHTSKKVGGDNNGGTPRLTHAGKMTTSSDASAPGGKAPQTGARSSLVHVHVEPLLGVTVGGSTTSMLNVAARSSSFWAALQLKQGSAAPPQQGNLLSVAMNSRSSECVQHLLDAVVAEKITSCSYHAVTRALPAVARQYPVVCNAFLVSMTLRPLGELEIPAAVRLPNGEILKSASFYTNVQQLWERELRLNPADTGPRRHMDASMVRLPCVTGVDSDSLLYTLVAEDAPYTSFGSDIVAAIINYKWNKFARRTIITKALTYLLFVLLFTAFAIMFSGHDYDLSLQQVLQTLYGKCLCVLSLVLFGFGLWYIVMELYQMYKLGVISYITSIWNIMDLVSYSGTVVIMPCWLLRLQLGDGQAVPAVVAVQTILLWFKLLFFGLAFEGTGTFIILTLEMIKGMRYFVIMLVTVFTSFAVSFMILFRNLPVDPTDSSTDYSNFGMAFFNSFMAALGKAEPLNSLDSKWMVLSVFLFSLYNFMLRIVLLNMLVSFMRDIYAAIKGRERAVFLKGRAELIMEVESTMTSAEMLRYSRLPPYLHILRPAKARQPDKAGSGIETLTRIDHLEHAVMSQVHALSERLDQLMPAGGGGGGGGTEGPCSPGRTSGATHVEALMAALKQNQQLQQQLYAALQSAQQPGGDGKGSRLEDVGRAVSRRKPGGVVA